jgi:hypothetical protein
MCGEAYETPALPPELCRLGRNYAQLQSEILARPRAGMGRIVPAGAAERTAAPVAPGAGADQDTSEDAGREAGGRRRSTAWRRAPAITGFMSTGAAWRMRKFAYSGV